MEGGKPCGAPVDILATFSKIPFKSRTLGLKSIEKNLFIQNWD